MQTKIIIFSVLFVVNVITFFIYISDKYREENSKNRVSQFWLMILAILGGGYGAIMAMLLFKSVAKIPKFKTAVPILFFCQLALIVCAKMFVGLWM